MYKWNILLFKITIKGDYITHTQYLNFYHIIYYNICMSIFVYNIILYDICLYVYIIYFIDSIFFIRKPCMYYFITYIFWIRKPCMSYLHYIHNYRGWQKAYKFVYTWAKLMQCMHSYIYIMLYVYIMLHVYIMLYEYIMLYVYIMLYICI